MNNEKRLPATRCVMCEKTIEQVGGMRIVAHIHIGIGLSNQYKGGGNPDYPYQSFQLNEDKTLFLTVWGEEEKWTVTAIENAKKDFQNNLQPWICQVCANRKCHTCGKPINYPVGSDIVKQNGCITHIPIIPSNLGCINKQCKNYKDLSSWNR